MRPLLEPVQKHLEGKEKNTIAQEENKLPVDIPTLLLFQNSHQLLHTASRNKDIQSYYSKWKQCNMPVFKPSKL